MNACSVVSNYSATPWTVAPQDPLSVEFSRQEYWNGLLFPTSGDIPNPRIEPASPALAGKFFGKPDQISAPLHTALSFLKTICVHREATFPRIVDLQACDK